MVLLDDAKKLFSSEDSRPKAERGTLLDKFGIPIQHLDFAYVEKCNDSKELEKILQILRSGEEGYYPDLMTATENRLSVVKPKSKLLRKICPVIKKDSLSKEERNELNNDIKEWVTNVSKDDSKLEIHKNKKTDKINLPKIRKTREKNEERKKEITKRISSTDYSSWDKYDVDTEMLKMDLKEENLKKSFVRSEKKKSSGKKTVQFREFDTDIEAMHEAHYEKDKGNEFFKTGDYKEALRHYTNSINCKPTVPCLTNRALTNIKLEKFKDAIQDCNSALAIEPNNVKSFLRKAQALDGLGQTQEALEIVEQAIELDPNNAVAQDLAEKFRRQCGLVMKNTRFSIQDINNSSQTSGVQEIKPTKRSREKSKVIIPIPGTSSMSPPYYIVCPENNPEKVKEETIRANTPSQMVHLVSVDNSDADDDDSCTVNHLKRICSNKGYYSKVQKISIDSDENQNFWSNNKNKLENGEKQNLSKTENKLNLKSTANQNNKQAIKNDKHAGGEPCMKQEGVEMPQDIHSPYSFLKTWNSADIDPSLEQYASILKSIDMNRIVEVIGCKLDNAMFSTIIKCLCMHFAVPGEVEKLYSILENIIRLPRFEIISMLISEDDKRNINILLDFLKQHGKCLPQNIVNKLSNS